MFVFIVSDNSPGLAALLEIANYWTPNELKNILFSCIEIEDSTIVSNAKNVDNESISYKLFELLNYAGATPYMNYLKCNDQDYNNIYDNWSSRFLFRISKKISKEYDIKLPKGFSLKSFLPEDDNYEEIEGSIDLEDIINNKIIDGEEDDTKIRYDQKVY